MSLPDYLDDDLENMIDLDDFAVEAVFAGGTVSAIFDDGYANALDLGGTSPALWVRTSEVTRVSAAVGGTVTVEGDEYTVARIEPDGTGLSVVILLES